MEQFNIYFGFFFEIFLGLTDTILKWDYPRTIAAKSGLIWFSGFRGEDLNVINCPLLLYYKLK
jgi:hypothetical protein